MSQRSEYAKHHPTAKPKSNAEAVLENVTLGKETEKAIMVTIDGTDHWMPLSQVKSMKRTGMKDGDSITVTMWIAQQKGLRS